MNATFCISGIYKKYYPELVAHVSQSEGSEGVAKADYEAVAIFNSPSIFSYGCLLQYLRNIAPQIRKLGLQVIFT